MVAAPMTALASFREFAPFLLIAVCAAVACTVAVLTRGPEGER